MEKKETMNGLQHIRGRFNFRQLFMVCVLIFSVAADILFDYVNAGFDPTIFKEASYWIMLGLTCLSVILITLTVRDFFREKELRENSVVISTQKQIDDAHAELIRRDLTTRFDEYVNSINEERKRKAYMDFLQYKISKARKPKQREKWQALLDKADADIKFLPTHGNTIKLDAFRHIKFMRVRISTIFSRVEKSDGDDENLESNETKHVSELVFKKLLSVIVLSVAFSTLFFKPGEFAVAILVSTFMKLFRTAMSISLGASDGQAFVRGTLLSKMKLRLDFIQKFLEKEKSKAGEKPLETTEAAA